MTEFLRPHLNGERFTSGRIPLEMLSDLSVLGDMVVEVAKWRYLEANPDRERSPRGFAHGISFSLVGVDEGSAIAVIAMDTEPPQLPGMPTEYEQYFIEARDAIIQAIAASERDEEPTEYLPQRCLNYFDRLGRRLREGESIDFPDTTDGASARLTRESRRRLVMSSQMKEVTQEVQVRGCIPEADQDRMSFELQLWDGHKVKGIIDELHHESIMTVFNKYRERGKALIQGIGKYDRENRLVSLISVDDITVLDALDVSSRLDDLRKLQDGWLDGEGKAPEVDFLDWVSQRFEHGFPAELPLPYVYPTPGGGIQAEWSLSSCEASLEIDPHSKVGEWHLLNRDTNEDTVETLNLVVDGGWADLIGRIRSLSEASA